jgi:hypothetical protein
MKSRLPRPGTFLQMPLANGTFGYARALEPPFYAVYRFATTDPEVDLTTVAAQNVLFSVAVHRVKGNDHWKALGVKALEPELTRPIVQYVQDDVDLRKCKLFDTVGMERDVGPEECVCIEKAAVWETHHVEARLLDALEGRPNDEELRSHVRLR